MITETQKRWRDQRRWDLRILRLALDRNDLTPDERFRFEKLQRQLRTEMKRAPQETRGEAIYVKSALADDERAEVTRIANKGLAIEMPVMNLITDHIDNLGDKVDEAAANFYRGLDAAVHAIKHGTH